MKLYNIIRRYIWIAIFPVAFIVYSNSFNNFKILEQKHSVLAEADSANFAVLIKDFHLSKKYGDEYNIKTRSLGDIAQKHKAHHVLYLIVASIIYKILSVIYQSLGISSTQALYSVNAFLSCCNTGLLYLLLKNLKPDNKNTVLYLVFYIFSLSTWIYGSIPESWTFSATLVLLFLLLFYIKKTNPFILSIFIGISMLNNIFLGSLLIFLVINHSIRHNNLKELVKKTILSGLITVSTWVFFMYLLSLFDNSLRPDNFLKYTLWFKKSIAPNIALFDTYCWKVAVSNLFINSILSNQSNPVIPQESLLYTIKQSYIGLISTLTYTFLLIVAILRMVKDYTKDLKSKKGITIIEKKTFPMIIFCIAWIFLVVVMDPSGAFLYSTLIVPVVTILIYHFIDQERLSHKILLYSVVALILFNNITQIMKFRAALRILS